MKFRFFTNVSHELRTPLTLIISPMESMMKEITDEKLHGKLQLMYRNAQRLLNLVNQWQDCISLCPRGILWRMCVASVLLS